MRIRTLAQAGDLKDKKVIVRCDFNVPIKAGKVLDDFKIKKTLPTIQYLLKKKAKIILISHLGRPTKKKNSVFSLKPIKNDLGKKLRTKIKLYGLDEIALLEKKKWKKGESVVMLENIRFSKDEEKDTGNLAPKLASLGDIFILDGFAVAHRASASVCGIAKFLPTYAGLLMEQEINGLEKLLNGSKKPFVVVLGGIKMETKIPVIKNLISRASYLLIGGGIASTYLAAKGYQVGRSLIEPEFSKDILRYGRKRKVIMPIDLVIGSKDGKKHEVIQVNKKMRIKKDWAIYDIGPKTVTLFAQYIKKAKTVVWNGAMGYFEIHPYQYGTCAVAYLVASRAKGSAYGVCGGGETVETLKQLKITDDIDFISTGGGAMLEYLAGKKLPGVKVVLS